MNAATSFAAEHKGQLVIVSALVVYSYAKKKLTAGGIIAAVGTAAVHMLHPWGVPFNLLVGFFVAGTVGTKVCQSLSSLETFEMSSAECGAKPTS